MNLNTLKKLYPFICNNCKNLFNQKVQYCGKCGSKELLETTNQDLEKLYEELFNR